MVSVHAQAAPANPTQPNISSHLSAETGQSKPKDAAPSAIKTKPQNPIITFKTNTKAEIRPDKSVWWFGANRHMAIMADGTHELKDGQKITTKGGKIVGKMPRPMKEETKPEPPKK